MNIEELVKRIDTNMENINDNSRKIEENFERISQNSGALEILKGFKSDSNRWFTILIIVLFMWFATIGYLIYVLNDTATVESVQVEQENENGYNNYIGNDGDITNG